MTLPAPAPHDGPFDAGRRVFWRSAADTRGAARGPHGDDELARDTGAWPPPVTRRRFLTLMGASLALGGAGCSRPPNEPIVPYLRQPEALVPGRPLFFATAHVVDGVALGVLVESHEGRPTKVEGNPDHPASRGATDATAQAAVLGLYDPDRARTITREGRPRPWAELGVELRRAAERLRARGGAGLRILTGAVSSPTLLAQLEALLERLPGAVWHRHEPMRPGESARLGARLALGAPLEPRYRLDAADVVLALDADLLQCRPATLPYVQQWASRRAPGAGRMSRLYAVEPSLSITGAAAEHRLPARAADVEGIARSLAARLGLPVVVAPRPPAVPEQWLETLARDLAGHRGRSLVVAGDAQPPAVHALAAALNVHLDNVGRTIGWALPPTAARVEPESIEALAEAMERGEVEVLLMLGGNPVHDAPADVRFGERLARVPLAVHLALHRDETGEGATWHVPEAHLLESWSDARAWDGTATIVQPLIAPLWNGRTAHELLNLLTEQPDRSAHETVRRFWSEQVQPPDFEAWWRQALHAGVVPGTARPLRPVALRADWSAGLPAPAPAAAGARPLEIVFRPDPHVHDGRFSNNAFLQELPKPFTKLVWDNAVHVSPALAARLGVRNEDVVELALEGRVVRGPVWITPGQAEASVTVHLGYGRPRAGRVGSGRGFDAYRLRASRAAWFAEGVEVRPTGERWALASTQMHHEMQGRDLVRTATLAQLARQPGEVATPAHAIPDATLYGAAPLRDAGPLREPDVYAWGMVIDLARCLGCNGCVVACQAENNIPVVGKEQVALGREMHWLRVDSYHTGPVEAPATYHQPVPCMHCEKAPCEPVCPVAATVHHHEGLNNMVYNRCVGTRYCSNNCPYKVRRFNFYRYADWETPSLRLLLNPDVTVRSRGVMEKCTYCIQRITKARIEAHAAGRRIRDGEVLTACQASCPTQAIAFGDLNDATSRVAALRRDPRHYALLEHLGTRPRTTYLAAIRNPNPALEAG